jgi:eukaryotic-like serine/threonine-protein kinase
MAQKLSSNETLQPIFTALADRYAIERELGQGGMATVFLARDLRNEQPVAIKVLHPDLAASIGGDRFIREIGLGSVLLHPNILGVLDSGRVESLPYYVMPYVEGESLRDRLVRQGQLSIDETIAIARQIANALAHAHEKQVVHRDIKPENILLEGQHVWVADFGVAHAVTEAGGETLTKTGMAVGTATYMSPEQAAGSRHVSAASDQYSLACVVYEMLAGQPPFTAPTALGLMARHSLDTVPSLRIVRATVPEHVELTLLKALAKVPADRFANVTEMAAGLAGELAPKRLTLSGSRPGTPAPKVSRRRRLTMAAVALLAVLGGGTVAAWRLAGAKPVEADLDRLHHVAVLYFDDRTNGELSHLAEGLTETLIQELGQVNGLTVVSRNGVAQFRNASTRAESIATKLQVGTIVSGTVQQGDGRVKVGVEVMNGLTGESEHRTVEAARANVLDLQESVARQVVAFLRPLIGQEVALARAKSATRNAAAWEALQRAKQTAAGADKLLADGDIEAASRQLLRADAELAKVEEMEPKWVTPVVQRGWLAYRQARILPDIDPKAYEKWIGEAMPRAEQALALAPNDADALELRGTLRYWRWMLNLDPDPRATAKSLADAEADLRNATVANRVQASAWNSLSHLLMAKSEIADANLAALTAYETDPYLSDAHKTLWRLFVTAADLGKPEQAKSWCDQGLLRFPADDHFTECRLWMLALKRETIPTAAEIWKARDAYVQRLPEHSRDFEARRTGMIAALALVRANLPDSARAVAVRSRGDSEIDPTSELTYLEMLVRAQLGDRDDAYRLLTTYLVSNPQYRATLANEPTWWLKDLQNDPRYKSLQVAGSG